MSDDATGRAGAPRLLPDDPIGAPEAEHGGLLWSGLTELAGRIDALIDVDDGRTPVLVTGPWGSGKTTVLRQLQLRREARPQTPQGKTAGPPTIWFEAWQHSGQGQLLPALCWTIWQQIPEDRRQDEQAQARLSRILQIAGTAALGFAATAGGVAATLSGAGWMAPLIGALAPASIGKDLRGLQVTDKPTHRPGRPPLVELHDALDALLRFGWADKGERDLPPGREPVIIVDDLDRCPPDEALALLDQLRTLVTWGERLPCRLVMAVDRGVLHEAVRHRFRGLEDYDGNRYLEKVFPMTFAIGSPGDQEVARLVRAQVAWMVAKNPGRWEATALGAWSAALMDALTAPDFHNPRLIKRVVSRFFLFQDWDDGGDIDLVGLAGWLAACERWPRLREVVALWSDAQWTELRAAVHRAPGQDHLLPPPAPALLAEKGVRTWLNAQANRPEVFDDLPRIDLRLRALGL